MRILFNSLSCPDAKLKIPCILRATAAPIRGNGSAIEGIVVVYRLLYMRSCLYDLKRGCEVVTSVVI